MTLKTRLFYSAIVILATALALLVVELVTVPKPWQVVAFSTIILTIGIMFAVRWWGKPAFNGLPSYFIRNRQGEGSPSP